MTHVSYIDTLKKATQQRQITLNKVTHREQQARKLLKEADELKQQLSLNEDSIRLCVMHTIESLVDINKSIASQVQGTHYDTTLFKALENVCNSVDQLTTEIQNTAHNPSKPNQTPSNQTKPSARSQRKYIARIYSGNILGLKSERNMYASTFEEVVKLSDNYVKESCLYPDKMYKANVYRHTKFIETIKL